MFSDRFGLTDLVLQKKKTKTRRIIKQSEINKVMESIIKPFMMTEEYLCNPESNIQDLMLTALGNIHYNVGEVIAIAQSYSNLDKVLEDRKWQRTDALFDAYYKARQMGRICDTDTGWNNKMFVRADIMPHRIIITDIRIQRLQDISFEDCIDEGIRCCKSDSDFKYKFDDFVNNVECWYRSPKDAYRALIDKINGKGTWNSNPYVFTYSFEIYNKFKEK